MGSGDVAPTLRSAPAEPAFGRRVVALVTPHEARRATAILAVPEQGQDARGTRSAPPVLAPA
jgi:hypothetical protein